MKKIVFLLGLVVLLASCKKAEPQQVLQPTVIEVPREMGKGEILK